MREQSRLLLAQITSKLPPAVCRAGARGSLAAGSARQAQPGCMGATQGDSHFLIPRVGAWGNLALYQQETLSTYIKSTRAELCKPQPLYASGKG